MGSRGGVSGTERAPDVRPPASLPRMYPGLERDSQAPGDGAPRPEPAPRQLDQHSVLKRIQDALRRATQR